MTIKWSPEKQEYAVDTDELLLKLSVQVNSDCQYISDYISGHKGKTHDLLIERKINEYKTERFAYYSGYLYSLFNLNKIGIDMHQEMLYSFEDNFGKAVNKLYGKNDNSIESNDYQ